MLDKKKDTGFTLIELLVVIAVIAFADGGYYSVAEESQRLCQTGRLCRSASSSRTCHDKLFPGF